MFTAFLQTCRQFQQGLFINAFNRDDVDQFGFAFSKRPGLINYQRVYFAHDLNGFGILEQARRSAQLFRSRP